MKLKDLMNEGQREREMEALVKLAKKLKSDTSDVYNFINNEHWTGQSFENGKSIKKGLQSAQKEIDKIIKSF